MDKRANTSLSVATAAAPRALLLLRHKKERALDALPAPEPEPELAAAPPKTREAFATQLGAEAQAGVGLAGEEAAAA